LFRRPGPTKQFPENLNDSSRMLLIEPRLPARDRRVRQIGRIFNLSLVEKRLGTSPTVTRSSAPAGSIEGSATFPNSCVLYSKGF
jgi:hypothetical protein